MSTTTIDATVVPVVPPARPVMYGYAYCTFLTDGTPVWHGGAFGPYNDEPDRSREWCVKMIEDKAGGVVFRLPGSDEQPKVARLVDAELTRQRAAAEMVRAREDGEGREYQE